MDLLTLGLINKIKNSSGNNEGGGSGNDDTIILNCELTYDSSTHEPSLTLPIKISEAVEMLISGKNIIFQSVRDNGGSIQYGLQYIPSYYSKMTSQDGVTMMYGLMVYSLGLSAFSPSPTETEYSLSILCFANNGSDEYTLPGEDLRTELHSASA